MQIITKRWRWAGWLGVPFIVGITVLYGKRHRWAAHLQAALAQVLRTIVNPANLPEVLFGVGVLIVLIVWWLPKGQAFWSQGASEKNRFDRENEARKTLAQIVGGVILLAGLYSSVKTFDLQQQGQITERFTKAIDQLGATTTGADGKPKPNLEVRLGGVYALERIAKDSPKDHWTIMEVLTAYIRQNASLRISDIARSKHSALKAANISLSKASEGHTAPADVQAILTVIGRRDITHDLVGHNIDLSGTDLSGADLIEADLENASLFGAYLDKTNLTRANLKNANLNTAYLERARLTGAHLEGANLFGTHLNGSILYHTDFRKAFGLGQDQLIGTLGDSDTLLSKTMKRPDAWSDSPVEEINKASKIIEAISKALSVLPL